MQATPERGRGLRHQALRGHVEDSPLGAQQVGLRLRCRQRLCGSCHLQGCSRPPADLGCLGRPG